ncbi:Pinin [Quillaja saponaria]|uniref:Pinin n=1 Tax=Quillaja saponaria TaxID=32244 RepID=A0AAD7P915_QUISA|nr:Pinin [Quillaja saponaria]
MYKYDYVVLLRTLSVSLTLRRHSSSASSISNTVGSTVVEKKEEQLRKEIEELQRQQFKITKKLPDPLGLRRGGFSGAGLRNFAANGSRQLGFVRPGDRNEEDQQPAKRRLSSAVVKVGEQEISEDVEVAKDVEKKEFNWRGSYLDWHS